MLPVVLTLNLEVGVVVPIPTLLFVKSMVIALVDPKYTFPSSKGLIFNGEQEWIFETYKSVIQFPEPPLNDKPLVPLDPLIPEVPDVPDTPLVPLLPSIPDVPLTPELPDVPLLPFIPEVPDDPFTPEVPADPLKIGISCCS